SASSCASPGRQTVEVTGATFRILQGANRPIMRVRKIARGVLIAGLALVTFAAANDRGVNGVIPPGSVPSFAGNPQYTALYQPTVPSLNRIRWSATIDFNNTGDLAHYGAPLVTAANTVL